MSLSPQACDQIVRERQLVIFHQRFADGETLRLHERVRHGAADQQAVDDFGQVGDHFDFVGDFRAAKNGDAGPRRIARHHGEIFELLLHEQTGGGFGHKGDHADGGRMRAVSRAECIVDVEIAERGELGGRIAGSFFSSSAWKRRFSSSSTSPGAGFMASTAGPTQSGAMRTGRPKSCCEARRQAPDSSRRLGLPFGTAKVRRQNHARAMVERVLDRGQRCANALVAGDLLAASRQRHVEIDANEDALALRSRSRIDNFDMSPQQLV